MDPVLLRTFLVVRRHRNFTRAAEELFISQPAVTRQIQQLERTLGVAMFDRLGKSLHVTEAGETLAAEAEELLAQLDRVLEGVRGHAQPGTGRLRIGAGTTPGLYMLPSLLGEFRRKFPEVELSYSIDASGHVVQQVLHNEIDIGFVGSAPRGREILCEPLADDEIVCFASPRHPAARRRSIEIGSLRRETWIVRPKGSATRALFDAWLGKQSAFERTIELGCPEGIRALVAAGVGISYLSIHALEHCLRRRRVVVLQLKGLPLRRSIWVVRHVDKRSSASMQAFLDMARGAFSR
jgi:DNA-binding transcriptional LysR family regulator